MASYGGFRLGAGRKLGENKRVLIQRIVDGEAIYNLSMNTVYRALQDDAIPLNVRAELGMRYISKYLPSKVESLSISSQLPPELLTRFMDLFERNLLQRKELDSTSKVIEVEAKGVDKQVDNELNKPVNKVECGGTPLGE